MHGHGLQRIMGRIIEWSVLGTSSYRYPANRVFSPPRPTTRQTSPANDFVIDLVNAKSHAREIPLVSRRVVTAKFQLTIGQMKILFYTD